MTKEQAIKHAKALKRFCAETDCRECPFSNAKIHIRGLTYLCRLVDYEDRPHRWDVEE